MKKQIVTTAAAMAATALMAFQPMTAFAATGNCGNGAYNNGCRVQVCQDNGCDSRSCGLNDLACGQNRNVRGAAAGNCGAGCSSVLSGISKKNLSGKNCVSPQMISYVIGNSGCRR